MCQINVLMLTKIHYFFQKLTHVITFYFTKIKNIDLIHGYMESQEQALKYSQCNNVAF